MTARVFDTARLRRLVDEWPENGDWSRREVETDYRYVLLRTISTAHFLRRASGSNR